MVDFEFEKKAYERIDISETKYILVDNIQGSKMLFNRYPLRGKYDVYYGMMFYCCWEPKETEFVKRFVKSGMTVMDVGVYLGYYTLLFAKIVGGNGRVISVEPSGESLEIAWNSARLNNYNNISFVDKALSDEKGDIPFDDDLLLLDSDDPKGLDTVEIITVDALMDDLQLSKLDFMKIDTDGYDGNVIGGMLKTFRKNPNLVVMLEYFPQMWDRVGMKPIAFKNLLEMNALNVFVLKDDCELEDVLWKELLSFPEMREYSIGDVLKSSYPDRTLIVTGMEKERLAFYLRRS